MPWLVGPLLIEADRRGERESIGEERLFLPSAELAATIDHLPQRPIHVIIPSRRSEREFEKDGGKWDQQESTLSPMHEKGHDLLVHYFIERSF